MVRIGDVAVIRAEPVELPNGRIVSRSLDNRVGCFVAYETLRLLSRGRRAAGDRPRGRGRARGDQLRRARCTTAYSLEPDIVARHRRHARDRRAGRRREGERQAPVRLRAGDRARRDAVAARCSSCWSRPRRRRASRTRSRRPAAATGTDADAVVCARAPASRPRRSACRAATCTRRSRWSQLDDVLATARLCAAFVRRLSPDVSLRLTLLILWDIDGTLLQRASREHARALLPRAARGARRPPRLQRRARRRGRGPHRRRDRARPAVCACGVEAEAIDREVARGRAAHRRGLRGAVPGRPVGHGRARASPTLLGALAGDPRYRSSLVTGNFEAVARLKLARAGIGDHFEPGQGGFGSDAEEREALPPIARARAGDWPRERTVVDRRHPARHRLRARRRPARRRRHHRPVRRRRARRGRPRGVRRRRARAAAARVAEALDAPSPSTHSPGGGARGDEVAAHQDRLRATFGVVQRHGRVGGARPAQLRRPARAVRRTACGRRRSAAARAADLDLAQRLDAGDRCGPGAPLEVILLCLTLPLNDATCGCAVPADHAGVGDRGGRLLGLCVGAHDLDGRLAVHLADPQAGTGVAARAAAGTRARATVSAPRRAGVPSMARPYSATRWMRECVEPSMR